MAVSTALAPEDDPRAVVTADQFLKMGEAGEFRDAHVELLGGVLYYKMPQSRIHIDALTLVLGEFVQAGEGCVLISQGTVKLGFLDAPEPDAAIIERDPKTARRQIQPEDVRLVIEVSVSSLRTDRSIKLPVYAKAGLSEYWILNPIARQIEVYREPIEGEYRWLRLALPGETISPLYDPGRIVAVDDLMPAPDED